MYHKTLLALDLGQIGGENGFGPWGNLGSQGLNEGAAAFTRIISNAIGVMTIIAGVWFIFQFISGAYGYMSASGNPEKMTQATGKITSALIGLVVVVAAYALISLIGSLLGYDVLNPQKIFEKLGPGECIDCGDIGLCCPPKVCRIFHGVYTCEIP
jgi:hypothetical protein